MRSKRDEVHEEVATETFVMPGHGPLGARIRILDAKASPAVRRLEEGTCVIGSAPSADIVVDDRAVSRAHVEITVVAGGVRVRDLGSRNGTYYLGQRLKEITLSHGSTITIGSARIAIDADAEALTEVGFVGEEMRGILGTSPSMRRLFGMLTRLEGSTVTTLVTGESGVGKELVSRALHDGSGVKGPLVSFNCGATARELVTSELFGHRRGAFTGAIDTRRGAFESADGGTLFLDEIGELPLETQPALLRVLETGEVKPVGGDQTSTVRVRLVAATHRDLAKEVEAGRFREDLYYRLAVITLHVPPLRERTEDIPLLARKFAAAQGLNDLPAALIEQLKQRPWPGNARELRNVVQAYAVLGSVPPPSRVSPAAVDRTLAALVDVSKPYAELKENLLESFQRVYLAELLASVRGNQTAAAKLAGMDRTYLGKLLARYGLTSSGDG